MYFCKIPWPGFSFLYYRGNSNGNGNRGTWQARPSYWMKQLKLWSVGDYCIVLGNTKDHAVMYVMCSLTLGSSSSLTIMG